MKIHTTFKATAATLRIGLGAIPRYMQVYNLTDRTGHIWRYDDITNLYGLTRAAAGDLAQAADAAHGIVAYAGGDKMSAASTAYLVRLETDQRKAYAVNAPITKFTIGSVANKTGNFDVEASTTYVGPGSRISFAGFPKVYTVVAMNSNGKQANEVTLDELPVTAQSVLTVGKIWPRFDFMGAAAGVVIPAGFTIGATATINDTNTDVLVLEADIDD